MIWHIFRKDLCLLWPVALLVAAMHILVAVVTSAQGLFGEPRFLRIICDLLAYLSLLCISFIAITVVHQDALPGVRQDWLVRPIRRSDLFLAKLLFVLLMAMGPLLAVDLIAATARGFSFLPALDAAFAHAVAVFLLFALPAMVVGAVTRNIVEALLMVIAGVIVCTGIGMFKLMLTDSSPGLINTGLEWMTYAALSLLALVAALVVLPLQFSKRKTMPARAVIAALALVAPLTIWLPWSTVFAVQQRLDVSTASEPIALAFAADATQTNAATVGAQDGESLNPVAQRVLGNQVVQIMLPLEFTGLPPDSRLFADRTDVRIVGADSAELYRGQTNVSIGQALAYYKAATLQVPAPQSASQAANVRQLILLPRSLYTSLKNQNVRLELDYSLTLLRDGPSTTTPAVGADQRNASLGWCRTRVDSDGDAVQIGCMSTQAVPRCGSVFLRQSVGELKNPAMTICNPSYEKMSFDLLYAFRRTVVELPFHDLAGQVRYAVDESHLDGAEIVFNTKIPQAHLTRALVIPAVRLSDWELRPAKSSL